MKRDLRVFPDTRTTGMSNGLSLLKPIQAMWEKTQKSMQRC